MELWGSLKVCFYLHCGGSAEDPRKIRGGPPRKIRVEELMVSKISKSPYGAAGKVESLLLLAPRKIRGGSAEDLWRTPAEDMSRGTHGKANQ